ncbi:MAG: hypothetical protein WCR06_03490 [bacterium]
MSVALNISLAGCSSTLTPPKTSVDRDALPASQCHMFETAAKVANSIESPYDADQEAVAVIARAVASGCAKTAEQLVRKGSPWVRTSGLCELSCQSWRAGDHKRARTLLAEALLASESLPDFQRPLLESLLWRCRLLNACEGAATDLQGTNGLAVAWLHQVQTTVAKNDNPVTAREALCFAYLDLASSLEIATLGGSNVTACLDNALSLVSVLDPAQRPVFLDSVVRYAGKTCTLVSARQYLLRADKAVEREINGATNWVWQVRSAPLRRVTGEMDESIIQRLQALEQAPESVGNDVEIAPWIVLAESYTVLGRTADAQRIYDAGIAHAQNRKGYWRQVAVARTLASMAGGGYVPLASASLIDCEIRKAQHGGATVPRQ